MMQKLFFVVTLFSMVTLMNCSLSTDNDCKSEVELLNLELFYTASSGFQYLNLTEDEITYQICVGIDPPSTPGFGNIYQVDGLLTLDCEGISCIKNVNFTQPQCAVSYSEIDQNFPLTGKWRLAYIKINPDTLLHPSCLTPSIEFELNTTDTSALFYTFSANMGTNVLQSVFKNTQDSLFSLQTVSLTDEFTFGYIRYFQEAFEHYLKSNQQLIIQNSGNILKISDTNDLGEILLFKPQ